MGLVFDAFGELSTSWYTPVTAIARVQAARLMNFYHMSRDQAMELAKQKLLRFWALTAQRG